MPRCSAVATWAGRALLSSLYTISVWWPLSLGMKPLSLLGPNTQGHRSRQRKATMIKQKELCKLSSSGGFKGQALFTSTQLLPDRVWFHLNHLRTSWLNSMWGAQTDANILLNSLLGIYWPRICYCFLGYPVPLLTLAMPRHLDTCVPL